MFVVSAESKINLFKYNTRVVASPQKSGKFTNSKLFLIYKFSLAIEYCFRCLTIPKHISKNYKKEKNPFIKICDGIVRIHRVFQSYHLT